MPQPESSTCIAQRRHHLPQFYSDTQQAGLSVHFYDIEQGIGTLGQIPDSVKTLLETLYEDEQTYTEAWEDVELLIL
ncbi:MAG: hypothetical protein KF852_13070 [Saprospiraceae bacterium]|nr:hypothetical protein [Saprospiraceae bacterium]